MQSLPLDLRSFGFRWEAEQSNLPIVLYLAGQIDEPGELGKCRVDSMHYAEPCGTLTPFGLPAFDVSHATLLILPTLQAASQGPQPVSPHTCAVAGVPARLYYHLSDEHTLLHVLGMAYTQFQLTAVGAGLNMGPCMIAAHMMLRLTNMG
jgi:hypothetical protein